MDHWALDNRAALLRRAGWTTDPIPAAGGMHFEFSVLPEQVLDFAGWLPELIRMKEGGEPSTVAAPPHECTFWGGFRESCKYGWSVLAGERYDAANPPRGRGAAKFESAVSVS